MPRLLENTLMAVRTNHQRLLLNEKWRVANGSCGIRTSQRSPMRSDCSSYQPVYRTTLPRMLMHSVPGAGQTATSRTGAPRNQPARAEPDTTCCSLEHTLGQSGCSYRDWKCAPFACQNSAHGVDGVAGVRVNLAYVDLIVQVVYISYYSYF